MTGAHAAAPTPGGLAVGAAHDGNAIYWLRTKSTTGVPVPGALSCTFAAAACELVGSGVPAYAPAPSRQQSPQADIDVVASDLGYHWVRGPAGTRLLRPPARVPCAPSRQAAFIYAAARWTGAKRIVRVLRQDRGKPAHALGGPITRSMAGGPVIFSKLLKCGTRTRLTYVVTSRNGGGRVTFSVARASLPKSAG